jgi:hypothetical protein
MRRAFALAMLLPLLALSPLWAQHGGGHASAGGHSGGASHGGFSGSSGAHSFSGGHSGSGFSSRPYAGGSAGRSYSSRNYNNSRGTRFRGNGYGYRTCWNCGWGYGGYYGYPYYPYAGGGVDPYWWGNGDSDDSDADSGNDQGYYNQGPPYANGLQNQMNGQRGQDPGVNAYGDQDMYSRNAPPPPYDRNYQARNRASTANNSGDEDHSQAVPSTILVFRDEHKQEVQNYAIVGQMLWIFAPQHTQKIPLTDLDIPATTKANDERGLTFHVPAPPEAQ